MSQLNTLMGYTRQATTRLTNKVPPGAANEERLTALYATHVTVQDNVADLVKRINDAASAGPDIAEGTYLGIAKDVSEVEQQAQAYVEAVEALISERGGETALAPTPNGAAAVMGQPGNRPWGLYLALAAGIGAVVWGVTQYKKGGGAWG
jgi:hypothetical protein